MRKLYRKIAHAKMRKAGLRKVNKRLFGNPSYFSVHWREWA